MGVQAFRVDDLEAEGAGLRQLAQGAVQTACGVFAEHQVLSVGKGEGLFVGAFYSRLYRCAEGVFGTVDQCQHGQVDAAWRQAQLQGRRAALAVRVARMPWVEPSQSSTLE